MKVIVYNDVSYRISEREFSNIECIVDEIRSLTIADDDEKVFYYEEILENYLDLLTKKRKAKDNISFIYHKDK